MATLLQNAVRVRLIHSYQAVLMALRSKHGIGSSSATIGKMTGLSNALVGFSKKELFKAGLIEERKPLRDQRVTKLYLTEDGQAASEELWELIRGMAGISEAYRDREPS